MLPHIGLICSILASPNDVSWILIPVAGGKTVDFDVQTKVAHFAPIYDIYIYIYNIMYILDYMYIHIYYLYIIYIYICTYLRYMKWRTSQHFSVSTLELFYLHRRKSQARATISIENSR